MANRDEILASTASVVTLGAFNPTIFHPSWLIANKVIDQREEVDFKSDEPTTIVFRELAVINLRDIGVDISVQRDRFSVTAKEDPDVMAKDIALNCLRLLPHTPTKAVGLNRSIVFNAPDLASLHKFGDALAPKAPWTSMLGAAGETDRPGGLHTMTMERSKREDGQAGYWRVSVGVVDGAPLQIKVDSNDHFDIKAGGEMVPASVACDLIVEEWEKSQARADKVINSILELSNVRAG